MDLKTLRINQNEILKNIQITHERPEKVSKQTEKPQREETVNEN